MPREERHFVRLRSTILIDPPQDAQNYLPPRPTLNVDDCKLEEYSFAGWAVLPFVVMIVLGPVLLQGQELLTWQESLHHSLLLLTWSVAALAVLTCIILNNIWRCMGRTPVAAGGQHIADDDGFLRGIMYLEYICLWSRWLTKALLCAAILGSAWRGICGTGSVVVAGLTTAVVAVFILSMLICMSVVNVLWHDYFG